MNFFSESLRPQLGVSGALLLDFERGNKQESQKHIVILTAFFNNHKQFKLKRQRIQTKEGNRAAEPSNPIKQQNQKRTFTGLIMSQ